MKVSEPKTVVTGTPVISEAMVSIERVSLNVSQKVIVTTEDKARIVLDRHVKRLEARGSWIAPLGLSLTILIALLTTKFQDLGLTASVWQALFVLSGLLSFLWFLYCVARSRDSSSVDDILVELVGEEEKPSAKGGSS